MPDLVHIGLLPLGKTITAPPGAPLQDLLFAQGVEFPCGGRGRCKGCRVRVLDGGPPVTPEDQRLLSQAELDSGWRLACCLRASSDLKLELAQWEAPILADETAFAFTPREGLGVAVDLGTTTVVAQLLELQTANVLAVRLGLNTQARHGADIMSRVDFAVTGQGHETLTRLIRGQIGDLISELLESAGHSPSSLQDIVLVGNTAMHHLFCGISVAPLAHHPFEPVNDGLKVFDARALGWDLPAGLSVRFLPCLGGFVGSDILAGILATGLDQSDRLVGLIDLGTNGEIVVGNRERLLCASTAAGPAFEGARISMGMRAASGAISEVTVRDGSFRCHVLGNTTPRGICGSGLVDAVSGALDLGRLQRSGRLVQGNSLPLLPPVTISQQDIRELQLAKGAIAAGLRLLLGQWGARSEDLTCIHLAGAFGNYINRQSAQRIGLLRFPIEKVRPAGNTALLGAKLALFGLPGSDFSFPALRARTRHVSLNEDPQFHEIYVEEMGFPQP